MLGKFVTTTIVTAMMATATITTVAFPTAAHAHDRHWRGDGHHHGRNYHHRRYAARCHDKGNGGLVIGAIAGGLLGHEVAHDKTAGTIVGGGLGALAGRHIDRKNGRC
jgi:hypothetical protein